jgi:hypothetical protein
MNPNSQIDGKIIKKCTNYRKGAMDNSDLTFPGSGLLSHFTNSCPKFPFSSLIVTDRFNGVARVQSGLLVIYTNPYLGHEGRDAELEVNINRRP